MKRQIRRDIVHFTLPASPRWLAFSARHILEHTRSNTLESFHAAEVLATCQSGPVHGRVTGRKEDFATRFRGCDSAIWP